MTLTPLIYRGLWLAACVALAGTYLAALTAPAAGTYHDDGIYMVTARALAEGKGYRIISMPGEPRQTKYPVLFPWLLSWAWRAAPSFPANLLVLRLVPLAGTVAWLILSWFVLRESGASRLAAWTVIALVAASPTVVFLSAAMMAETVFAAFLTAGVLVLIRMKKRPEIAVDGLIPGLLMGAALLTRAAGVAPVVAAGLTLLYWRRWRTVVFYGLGTVLVTVPWLIWVIQHNAEMASVDAYYSASPYSSWHIFGPYAMDQRLAVVTSNLIYVGMAPQQFWGVGMPVWLSLGVAGMVVIFIVRGWWRTRETPLAMVVAVYLAMVIAWIWPPFRFMAPIAPLMAWLVIMGAGRTTTLLKAIALVIVVISATSLWRLNSEIRERGMAWPAAGQSDDWRQVKPLFEWIASRTEAAAIVAGNLDPTYYLYTGRRAIRAFTAQAYPLYYGEAQHPLGTPQALRDRLLAIRADYLVVTPDAGFGEMPHFRTLVAQLSRDSPRALSIVAGTEASGYVVYAVHRDELRLSVASTP